MKALQCLSRRAMAAFVQTLAYYRVVLHCVGDCLYCRCNLFVKIVKRVYQARLAVEETVRRETPLRFVARHDLGIGTKKNHTARAG